jgi:hypothetical protein
MTQVEYTYRIYEPDEELSALDLREESATLPESLRGEIVFYTNGGTQFNQKTEFVYTAGRLGIACGSPATWADADDLESGIHMWLTDGEEWDRRN